MPAAVVASDQEDGRALCLPLAARGGVPVQREKRYYMRLDKGEEQLCGANILSNPVRVCGIWEEDAVIRELCDAPEIADHSYSINVPRA